MKLTKNFDSNEFTCHCGCGFDDVALHFVQKLQKLRDMVGFPLQIVSGCRCPYWNKHEGGKDNSAHLIGLAVDIACSNSYKRYLIIKAAVELGFKRFAASKSFIHLDLGEEVDLPNPRIWVY